MPSWNDLIEEFQSKPSDDDRRQWISAKLTSTLADVGRLRNDRQVLLYSSAFLQKPWAPADATMITHEDLNGFMATIYGMDCSRGLTLIVHTPGGVTNAAESVVAYLRSKFTELEVIVPGLAMSAGTMISLASDRIVMGRQSQLGPIDPQMGSGGGTSVSARAIVEQFERARDDVMTNTAVAHIWAPIVASLGPALLQEAQNALEYSERMVSEWLSNWMLKNDANPKSEGKRVAKHFNDASVHKSHGRRIGREEAKAQGVVIEELESNQELQEAVLTGYHLMTIMFEHSAIAKMLWSSSDRTWMKNVPVPTPP